jgi:hypothetical protein
MEEPRFHRAGGDAERSGDSGDRLVVDVMAGYDLPGRPRQTVDNRDETVHGPGRRFELGRRRLELNFAQSTAMPKEIAARVSGDRLEPSVKPVWISQRRQPSPGCDESLLGSVARVVRGVEDVHARRVARLQGGADDELESVRITELRSNHEISVHHSRAFLNISP